MLLRCDAFSKIWHLIWCVTFSSRLQEGLKEQDKILLRQFLDLRAAIRSLRAEGGKLRTLSYGGREDKTETLRQQSNGSDATDANGADDDDDDVFTAEGTPSANSALHQQCRIEFRGRTVSYTNPRDKYHTPNRHFTNSWYRSRY